MLVAGSGCSAVADAASKIDGVTAVTLADHDVFAKFLPETFSKLLLDVQTAGSFTHILGSTSSSTKAFLPRAAALLDVAPISDVIEIDDAENFKRPIYAGNAIASVKSTDALKILTVRPTNFEKAAEGSASAAITAMDVTVAASDTSEWVSAALSKSDRPELASAGIVISGGRGLKSGDNFAMLDSVADKLKAAVGASRAAVDAGFVPNDMQVGQTGKVVAPDLYVAVGISGAIQHLAGMKDSKVIAAINKDPDAPIFQVSDYGLVGDLFTAVPEFDEGLSKMGYPK